VPACPKRRPSWPRRQQPAPIRLSRKTTPKVREDRGSDSLPSPPGRDDIYSEPSATTSSPEPSGERTTKHTSGKRSSILFPHLGMPQAPRGAAYAACMTKRDRETSCQDTKPTLRESQEVPLRYECLFFNKRPLSISQFWCCRQVNPNYGEKEVPIPRAIHHDIPGNGL
jgi:hypothetical protein